MNVCIVSTFEGTTEDYMEMFNATKENTQGIMQEYDLGIIREGKVMLMMQISDMSKMQEVLSSDEMQAWDEKFNCVDEIYVLDKMNLECSECVVIEDSEIGFQSATSAGLKTVITLSEYTNTKNFKGALVVLDHLGEDDQPFQIVNGTPTTHTLVSVDYIKELYECNR